MYKDIIFHFNPKKCVSHTVIAFNIFFRVFRQIVANAKCAMLHLTSQQMWQARCKKIDLSTYLPWYVWKNKPFVSKCHAVLRIYFRPYKTRFGCLKTRNASQVKSEMNICISCHKQQKMVRIFKAFKCLGFIIKMMVFVKYMFIWPILEKLN